MTWLRAWILLSALLVASTAPAQAPVPQSTTGVGTPTRASTAQANVHVLPPMKIPGLDRERTIRLYLPPHYDESKKRYPVVYMHDGQNLFDAATSFLGEWEVDETLNALAASQGLELIVVGIDNGGLHRMQELDAWDNDKYGKGEGAQYMAFIVGVVKPYIDARYRTYSDRTHTAIVGSSLGGLISHYAIARYPHVFGKAGVLSPAYWFAPAAFKYIEAHPLPHDARVYFYCGGREDESMLPNMRRMVDIVRESGLPPDRIAADVDVDAQHNEAAWRKEFPRVIEWLFAGG